MADEPDLVTMTIEVVANYVAHNTIAPDDVPSFIAKTHAAIRLLNEPETPGAPVEAPASEYVPAVSVRKSLASPQHILSLIDGKPYKTLKRHLGTHGLTPAEYRERYKLKRDYPMVAPAYSEQRREVARTLGLGQKGKGKSAVTAPVPEEAQAAPKALRARRGASKPSAVIPSAVTMPAPEETEVTPKAAKQERAAPKAAAKSTKKTTAAKSAAPKKAPAKARTTAPKRTPKGAASAPQETPSS